ncbi:hypothetical protein M231_05951 [Tremella mesenterica]|uniref:Uncharacterized protein n=1 Tax=Tremella mesenterica TaxID=5217 RepID=A0A4Q1BGT5_TREME|nr:hypothetical protein M231_05951 [Tremella mesenterica]
MKSFFAIAALSALGALAQSFSIATPITWVGGTGPFILAAIPASQVSAPAIEQIADGITSSPYTWKVNLAANTAITIKITDAQGNIAYSSAVTVQTSSDSSCVGAAASAASSGSATSAAVASSGVASASPISTAGTTTSAAAVVGGSSGSASATSASARTSASGTTSSASTSKASGSSAPSASSSNTGAADRVSSYGLPALVLAGVGVLIAVV